MRKRIRTRVTDERGNIHLWYALGLLALAIIAQPSVALGILYQLELLLRLLYSQLLSVV